MGVGDAAALADGAEDVHLAPVLADLAGRGLCGGDLLFVRADGVAQGLAVDGDGVVGAGVVGVEALQGAVELVRVDAHRHVADDELAGHLVAAASMPAAEPLAGARGQVRGPLGHGLVAARAAQRRAGGDGEHDGQRVAATLAAARVVDVGEEVGQGTHGVGGDHGLRPSVSVDGKQFGAGQARPRAASQGAHEHQLGRGRHRAAAAAHAAEAARAPDARPVRGAVHRAAVARRVDERLQQQRRMPEARRPVAGQAPLAQRQHPRAQVRHPAPRQDQEPAVVGEQVLAVVLGAEVPADPAVPSAALQRRRREAEQRQPLAAPVRDVPQRLADLRQRAQEMVRRHQLPAATFVPRRHRLDRYLAQLQSHPRIPSNRIPSARVRCGCPAFAPTRCLRSPSGSGQIRPGRRPALHYPLPLHHYQQFSFWLVQCLAPSPRGPSPGVFPAGKSKPDAKMRIAAPLPAVPILAFNPSTGRVCRSIWPGLGPKRGVQCA